MNAVSMFAQTNICPVVSLAGGLVAQEIIKWTGKYQPLDQWFHCDWFEALPENVEAYNEKVDRSNLDNRYGDMTAIFG